MKKLMLGLMLAFAMTAEADTVTVNGIKYSVDTVNKTASITGYVSGQSPTSITDTTVEYLNETYIVTYVANSAFRDCSNLTSVSLPTVTTIGQYAFYGCSSLTSVSLPRAIVIGGSAFSVCRLLTAVSLPTVAQIDNRAFATCTSLTSISLPSATSVGSYAFYECSSLESASLPSATTISERVFSDCISLTSVSMPMATAIEKRVFAVCSSLTSLSLPSAATVGEKVFSDCTSLTFVSLPSATSLGASAFLRTSLSALTVNEGMKSAIGTNGKNYYSIPDGATITVFEPLLQTVVKAAEYEAQVSASVKSGDISLDEDKYLASCVAYGIVPQPRPTAKDYKVVSKDAEIVPEGHIAVSKESIAAPSADTVKVEDSKVQLGVTVLKTSDLTAEKKDWNKVKLTKEDIDVDADGNIIVNVPVDSASGFMVIRTKDAAK